jgi:hypothetical protein
VPLRTDLKFCLPALSVCISYGSSHGSHFKIILTYLQEENGSVKWFWFGKCRLKGILGQTSDKRPTLKTESSFKKKKKKKSLDKRYLCRDLGLTAGCYVTSLTQCT